jgi:hypothetical protein
MSYVAEGVVIITANINLHTTFNANILLLQKCDALIAFVMTGPRLKVVDVSHPYLYMPVSLLIPMPTSSVSVSAVLESFQIWV